MTIDIPEPINQVLLNWARWARSNYLPIDFWVQCKSAEHLHRADAGEVMDTTIERLESIRGKLPPWDEQEAVRVETTMLRMPHQWRKALRLHFVVWREMSINQKCRSLGVSHQGYPELICAAAAELASRLRQGA